MTMRRRERTQVLVDSAPELAHRLAARVEEVAQVVDVTPAHQGLVLCQVRETARNQRFYLGEALMSEARVRIGSTVGLGAALGGNGELARDLAVIDAALSQPEPLPVAAELEAELVAAKAELERDRAVSAAQALSSRVEFNTMRGQDKNVIREVK